MPESAPPDSASLERELHLLEESVGHLVTELEDYRERMSDVERERARLAGLFRTSGIDDADPSSLERRLRELSEENSRLKEILREARVRAGKIRSRLIVMEDESAG